MKRTYLCKIPMTDHMSPIDYVVSETTMETKEENALWYYNNSRGHDGLPPIESLPRGTRFIEKCAPWAALEEIENR